MAKTKALSIRMPNWIGDALMALPAVQAICDQGIAVTCLGKPWLGELFKGHDFACVSLPKKALAARAVLKELESTHGCKEILLLEPNDVLSVGTRSW